MSDLTPAPEQELTLVRQIEGLLKDGVLKYETQPTKMLVRHYVVKIERRSTDLFYIKRWYADRDPSNPGSSWVEWKNYNTPQSLSAAQNRYQEMLEGHQIWGRP